MNDGFKMVFVANGHNPSSIRWALSYLRDGLVSIGTEISIVDLGRGGKKEDCDEANVVMVYRTIDEKVLGMMRRWREEGKVVLYFLDDYIFQERCKYGGSVAELRAPLSFMDVADILVSSSSFLLSKMSFDKPKIWRRTVMGSEGMEFSRQDYRRGKTFSIGLTAGKGRKGWTDGLVSGFLKEADAMMGPGESFVFHYFGEKRFPSLERARSEVHEYIPTENWMEWSAKLKGLDLGLVLNPLEEDDEWCWCKSGLKFVEAGAMGVPLVTSRVPPYLGFLEEGKTGFFASTSKEFAEKVLMMMRDEGLSRKMSANVLETVRKDFDVVLNARKFLDDVNEAVRKVK